MTLKGGRNLTLEQVSSTETTLDATSVSRLKRRPLLELSTAIRERKIWIGLTVTGGSEQVFD